MVIAALRIPVLLDTDFEDLTFDTRSQQIALAEPAIAIMISCSPLLKPVLDKALVPFLGQAKTMVSRKTPVSKAVTDPRNLYGSTTSRAYTRFDESHDEFELNNAAALGSQQTRVTTFGPLHPADIESMELGHAYDSSKILITREMIVTDHSVS